MCNGRAAGTIFATSVEVAQSSSLACAKVLTGLLLIKRVFRAFEQSANPASDIPGYEHCIVRSQTGERKSLPAVAAGREFVV
jgi:hypothetical protein